MAEHFPFPDESASDPTNNDSLTSNQNFPVESNETPSSDTIPAVLPMEPAYTLPEPAPTLVEPPVEMQFSAESPTNLDVNPNTPSFEQNSFPPPGSPSAPVGTPPTPTPPPAIQPPLSVKDERTFAMLAHLSVLLNLFTGFLGPIAALVIYLLYKDRSRYVAYQSMQAFVFQLIAWVGGWVIAGLAWTISGVLAAILVGCLLMPFALLLSFIPFAALVYGVIGAVQTNNGQDFRYWLIGDMVKNF